jgi:catechol 2,3-dioxygenase-like lactoylglutathione lyase family enzyme
MGIQIVKPLHTALLVSDVEKAVHFYGKVLGLERCDRHLTYPGAWYQLGDYQLHLIQDESTPSGIHNAEKLGRNRHVAFGVADIQQARDWLESHGYSVQRSSSGRPALFTHDPDGNVVELTEVLSD